MAPVMTETLPADSGHRRRALLLAPLALAVPARAQTRTEVGAVAEAVGRAEARFGSESRPLAPPAPVLLNDTLRTGPASRLAVQLAGGIALRLTAEASLRIDRFVLEARGTAPAGISFGAGRRGGVWLEGPPGAMPAAVESAWALVAVRGTAFFAGEVDRRYVVFVRHGSVSVASGGSRVVLEAGQGCDVLAEGEPPTRPVTWRDARVARTLGLVGL
jgi:ferric-dicitrate binding protein FerR (iron transport regulator)